MASQENALDEIQWRSNEKVMELGGIHSNTILYYFAASPFFDVTSNNANVFNQALYNQQMTYLLGTRELFEGRLKTMSGLEFVVAQEPAEMAPGTGTGVWVIRKQTRRKIDGQEDQITVHSTYFVVGENIYMAPVVQDVLGMRMLSVTNSLNKFVSIAAALPNFSPALGHTYFPPSTNNRLRATESQLGQTSKEATPLPDSIQSKKAITSSNNSTFFSSRLLEQTINISLKYGDEYMDEIPITGTPGEFHLSSTGRKADKLMVPTTAAKGPLQTVAKNTPAPPALKTDIAPTRKGSKSKESPKTPSREGPPKPKRRKSKALLSGAVSPT